MRACHAVGADSRSSRSTLRRNNRIRSEPAPSSTVSVAVIAHRLFHLSADAYGDGYGIRFPPVDPFSLLTSGVMGASLRAYHARRCRSTSSPHFVVYASSPHFVESVFQCQRLSCRPQCRESARAVTRKTSPQHPSAQGERLGNTPHLALIPPPFHQLQSLPPGRVMKMRC